MDRTGIHEPRAVLGEVLSAGSAGKESMVMLEAIARHWWALLIRGICAIAFGVLAFAWPGISILFLTILFGAYAILNGVAAVALGTAVRAGGRIWWEMALVGLLSIAAGILACIWPGLTVMALLFFIAGWAIACGVFEIVAAIKLRKVIENEWILIVAGIASVAFGAILFLRPGAGALALVWFIGGFAIAIGILEVMLAFRLRALRHRLRALSIAPRMGVV